MGQPVSRLSQRCQTLASWSQRNHSEALYSVVKSLLQPHWLKSNGVAKGLQKVRAAAIRKFYHRLSAVDLSLAPATIKILGQSAARSRNLLQAHRPDNYRSLSCRAQFKSSEQCMRLHRSRCPAKRSQCASWVQTGLQIVVAQYHLQELHSLEGR